MPPSPPAPPPQPPPEKPAKHFFNTGQKLYYAREEPERLEAAQTAKHLMRLFGSTE